MGKFSVFIIVIFFGVVALFAINNHEVTTIKVPFGAVYDIPKIALILLSSGIGFLATLFIFAIRDTKKYIDNGQYQKRQKQGMKVQELYSRALNSIPSGIRAWRRSRSPAPGGPRWRQRRCGRTGR